MKIINKMETNFTKGEWSACCLDKNPHYVFAGEAIICAMRHNDPIETRYDKDEEPLTIDECIANARLIQAAPDLLEACIYALKTLYSIGCTNDAEIVQELEKVIKKATE